MTFDPANAYHNDWQFQNFIEDATWIEPTQAGPAEVNGFKARWGDFNTSELQTLAAGIAFTSDAAAVVLWEPKPDDTTLDDWTPQFAPQQGDVLRRDSTGERWLIMSFKRSRFGFWMLACDKEIVNG